MMEIRKIGDEDVFEAVSLSEYAFNLAPMSGKKVAELQRREKKENTWGLFIDSRLCAKIVIVPLQIYLHSKLFEAGGVMSVATWPGERRKGYSQTLIMESLKIMKEQGGGISILHPFSYSFYRRYGWEIYCEYKKYTISLPVFTIRDRYDEGAVMLKKQEWGLLNEVYDQYASTYNGMLKRTPEWWTLYKNHSAYHAVNYDGDKPTGYLLYNIQDRHMEIDEFVYLDGMAQRALLQYIQNHDSSVDTVSMKVPADDKMSLLLKDPILQQKTMPYFMARIVDVESVIAKYPFASTGKEERVLLRISDEQAEWNNGLFEITIASDGSAHVCRTMQHTEEAVRCGIGALTAILMGYQTASTLYQFGHLTGQRRDIELLDAIVPRAKPYILDLF
jgi:predicted acetyltransferase